MKDELQVEFEFRARSRQVKMSEQMVPITREKERYAQIFPRSLAHAIKLM